MQPPGVVGYTPFADADPSATHYSNQQGECKNNRTVNHAHGTAGSRLPLWLSESNEARHPSRQTTHAGSASGALREQVTRGPAVTGRCRRADHHGPSSADQAGSAGPPTVQCGSEGPPRVRVRVGPTPSGCARSAGWSHRQLSAPCNHRGGGHRPSIGARCVLTEPPPCLQTSTARRSSYLEHTKQQP